MEKQEKDTEVFVRGLRGILWLAVLTLFSGVIARVFYEIFMLGWRALP